LLKWSLGGPLPKLCLAFQTFNQDGQEIRPFFSSNFKNFNTFRLIFQKL
jgi:hypothetical protein